MVANDAFGMGINLKSIRRVIEIGVPKDVETLLNQFGRAGRDVSSPTLSTHALAHTRPYAHALTHTPSYAHALTHTPSPLLTTRLPLPGW